MSAIGVRLCVCVPGLGGLGLGVQSDMGDAVFALGDDEFIFFHEVFHDFEAAGVEFVHLPELFLFFVESIHEIFVLADEAEAFPEQVRFAEGGWSFLEGVPVLGRVQVALDVGLVLGDLVLEVLKVHLHLLLQLDVTADGGLQLLGLHLQGGVAVDAHEVLGDHLDEVLDEVVGEKGLRGVDVGVLVELREIGEVVLSGEHGFECVEDGVLGVLDDFLGVVAGRGEEGLELLDHYKWEA